MDDCKIITDLLPTYCDDLTSWETNTFIRTHLNSCPGCSRLLEKMQQNRGQQKEADLRRGEFKAAMAAYERNHRTRVCLVALACLLLIGMFFALHACSFDLAIAASGLNRKQLEVVQEPTTDTNGKVFQIVFSRTEEGYGALAWLTKNALGFWSVSAVETATPDQPYSVAQITWVENIFSYYGSEPHITTVFHMAYAGCNATGSLEQLSQEQIPGNVAVLVNQRYSSYYIHVITVLPDGGAPFDILPLLKDSNLIA